MCQHIRLGGLERIESDNDASLALAAKVDFIIIGVGQGTDGAVEAAERALRTEGEAREADGQHVLEHGAKIDSSIHIQFEDAWMYIDMEGRSRYGKQKKARTISIR